MKAQTKTTLKQAAQSINSRVINEQVASDVESNEFSFRDFALMAGIELPSWKRTLCALIVSLGASYVAGSVMGTIMQILLVGAAAVTGSMFIATIAWAIGLLLAIYVTWKVGAYAFGLVVTKKAETKAVDAKNSVVNFFRSPPKDITPAPAAA